MKARSQAAYRSAGLLILFLAVGAFLRIETLTKRPLWHDEIYTLGVVNSAHSLADIASQPVSLESFPFPSWGRWRIASPEHEQPSCLLSCLRSRYTTLNTPKMPGRILC